MRHSRLKDLNQTKSSKLRDPIPMKTQTSGPSVGQTLAASTALTDLRSLLKTT